MKKFRKFFSFIITFSILIVMLVPNVAFAKSDNITDQATLSYKTYQKYINDGILGSDVSFDDWKALVESSRMLEEQLSNSTEFTEVYSSKDDIISSKFKTKLSDTGSIKSGTGKLLGSSSGSGSGGSSGTVSKSNAGFAPRRGDIFVTNGTSSAGILGHAGIALDEWTILHIAGPGYHPTTISVDAWNSLYSMKNKSSWTKVYRHSSQTVAYQAATWASTTYKNSGATYKITADLTSTNETYCSKIVWQAYYYGPTTHQGTGLTWGYRLPYDLDSTIKSVSYQNTYSK